MRIKRDWIVCSACKRSFKPEDFEIYEGEVWIICEWCRKRALKYKSLSWETKEALLKRDNAFDYDITTLFDKDLISFVDYEDIKSKLRTKEAKDYLESIIRESEPEDALDEYLFQKDATIGRLLRWRKIKDKTGKKPDYSLDERRFIAIELKSLFERARNGLKQKELKWENWKRQIYNYTRDTKYLVLTNYKNWYFFNAKDCISEEKCEPFYECDLFGLLEDFRKEGDFKELIIRKERDLEKEDLDERFFRNLGEWVRILEEINFEVSEEEKKEAIIGLINKFIFIDTLDDFQVIEPLWVRNYWYKCEEKTEDFLRETNMHFFLKYDTELFKDDFITKVTEEESNLKKLEQSLKTVLGLSSWQGVSKEFKGITQYKFRNINEDIFGKAYEKYLASLRKERGIYYTPSYVTEYIVENTVGAVFDEILDEIKKKLSTLSTVVFHRRKKEKERTGLKSRRIELEKRILLRDKLRKELEELEKDEKKLNVSLKYLAKRFIEVKILDPACGSGSFLIKAMRLIWIKYKELKDILEGYYGKIDFPIYNDINELTKLNRIDRRVDRELISYIILRHIHGIDLDERALSVAKVNIWEEGVKLSPQSFKEDKLPEKAIHILPSLEMNLRSGDSLVGLPEDLTVKYLQENHKEEIAKLFKLQEEYLNNPAKIEKVEEIEEIREGLRRGLDGEFEKYLEDKNLPLEIVKQTKPFHWALEFWFAVFNENGEVLPEEERGFDAVVGNPPYVRIQNLIKVNPCLVEFFNQSYESAIKNYDIYVLFIEKALSLLNNKGAQAYIVTHRFIKADYGEGIRSLLSSKYSISEILDFDGYFVFPEASINTCILIVRKAPIDKLKYIHVLITRGDKENIEDIIELSKQGGALRDGRVTIELIDQTRLGPKPWLLSGGERGAIFEKVTAIEPKLGKTSKRIFQGVVTGADKVFILEKRGNPKNGLVKVYSKATEKEYEFEEEILKPLLRGGEIRRYETPEWYYYVLFPYKITEEKAHLIPQEEFEKDYPRAWTYLLENKEALENRERRAWKGRDDWYAFGRRQNIEQFEQPKIMTCVLSSVASYTLDNGGIYYFVGGGNAGGYGITLKENWGIPLEYVLGLTNSKLLDFIHHNISVRCYQTAYSYAKRFIENLPIKIPKNNAETNIANKIKSSVDKTMLLKKTSYKLRSLWKEWSENLTTKEEPLQKIITEGFQLMGEGKSEKAWITKASFNPEGKRKPDSLTKQFDKFEVIGDYTYPILRIYGLEGGSEEMLYEMTFRSRDLMLHVYSSLVKSLESKAKIKTLAELLDKTSVPVIKEVNKTTAELTPNILRKAEEEFEEWKRNEGIKDIEPDIVRISNEIEDLDAKIDALVFELYGLDRKEVVTVLESLNVPEITKNNILMKFGGANAM